MAVVVRVAVGAHAERRTERAVEADEETARRALIRSGLGERAVRATLAVVPTLGDGAETFRAKRAHPTQTEVVADGADLRLRVLIQGIVTEGVGRDQPRVVVGNR